MPGAVTAQRALPCTGEGLARQMALCPPGGRHPGGCRQVLHPAVEEAAPGTGASLGEAHLATQSTGPPRGPTVQGAAPGRGLWAGRLWGRPGFP